MSEKRGRVREGRTGSHVSDLGCIPLGDITVELIGNAKRYTKETKRYKVYRKSRELFC